METIKLTQHQRILKYIEDFGSISPIQAFSDLGITKLATRVSELRRKGYPIVSEIESARNRYDEPCHYKRYFFEKPIDNTI